MNKIPNSEITPEHVYHSRRQFIKAAALVAGTAVLSACGVEQGAAEASSAVAEPGVTKAVADELQNPLTDYQAVANYNNYYEFTTDKEGVARLAQGFKPEPWTVEVAGLVHKPKTFALEDIRKRFPAEERVYRLRCVEGWSMVIPWLGFPLGKLLSEVEPMGSAKFVRFQTVMRPQEMRGQRDDYFPWPYTEGLRIDEAMHDLTLMVTGLYGKDLPNQNGAPLRLALPWKYGFKSAKAIVKIELVEQQPTSLWMASAPNEYGFYANVNPDVPHPRWSQSTERRIGEWNRRNTLLFNGYSEQVGALYSGMDLRANF